MEYISASILIAALGVIVSIAAFSRNKTKDDKVEGREDGIVMSELGYIKGSIDNVSKKMDKQDERHLAMVERLSKVEASAKQAHLRIDRMEGREYPCAHEHDEK